MSFGGHVYAMIKSLAANRKLRDKKSFFKNHTAYKHTSTKNEIFQRKPTVEELIEVKTKIDAAKKEQQKLLTFSSVIAIVIVIFIALIIRWFILNDMELF